MKVRFGGAASSRMAIVVGLLVPCFVIAAGPARATNWPGKTGLYGICNGLNQADNKAHTYGYNNASSQVTSNQAWVNANVISATAVTMSYHSSVTSLTDAVLYDSTYALCGQVWWAPGQPGVVGLTGCMAITGGWGSDCEQHRILLHWPYISQASADAIRKTLAHEMGHSFGLDHMNGGVMQQFAPLPSNYYTTHDKGHLANGLD